MPYAALPKAFAFLARERAPKILLAALADYGLREAPGRANHPRIMQMAQYVGARGYYLNDATAWCALSMSTWAKQAGYKLPHDPLAAKNWARFGTAVPIKEAMLGDILVMPHHTTLYVGEQRQEIYFGLGANQSDTVNIQGFEVDSLIAVRRCNWQIAQPKNVRKIYL